MPTKAYVALCLDVARAVFIKCLIGCVMRAKRRRQIFSRQLRLLKFYEAAGSALSNTIAIKWRSQCREWGLGYCASCRR
jgi:hypothetical protein